MRKALARPRVSSDAVSVLSSRNTTVLTAMPRSRSESPRLVTLENTLNSSSGTTSAAMTCDQITPKTPTYCAWPWAISPSAMPSAVAMMTRRPNPAVRVRLRCHSAAKAMTVAARAAQSMNCDGMNLPYMRSMDGLGR